MNLPYTIVKSSQLHRVNIKCLVAILFTVKWQYQIFVADLIKCLLVLTRLSPWIRVENDRT